jgi:hypothetical protein
MLLTNKVLVSIIHTDFEGNSHVMVVNFATMVNFTTMLDKLALVIPTYYCEVGI